MKRIIVFMLVISTLFACCACQPTPEKPPVVSKNDGQLEKAIFEGADEDYSYEAPEKFSYEKEYMGGAARVTCDNAAVSVLKNSNYAVYSAKQKTFTADDFVHIADVCFPNAVVTRHLDEFSKKDIYKYFIEPLEKELWELENGEYTIPDDITVGDDETGEVFDKEKIMEITKNSVNVFLSYAKSDYEKAPDAETGEPFDISTYTQGDSLSLDMTQKDGTVGRIYYTSSGLLSHLDVSLGEYRIEHTRNGSIGLSDLGGAGVHSEDDIKSVKVSDDDARMQAEEFMQKMGMDNDFGFCTYSYNTAYSMTSLMQLGSEWDYDRLGDVIIKDRKTYRGVIFTRVTEGVPAADFSAFKMSYNPAFEYPTFYYERFIVWVGDNGVAGFSWDCPLETELLQSSVVLMPFEEIKERVCDGLYYRCAGGYTQTQWVDPDGTGQGHDTEVTYPLSSFKANVCMAELRYMQVKRRDAVDEFLLLPVWCVYCDSASAEYEGYKHGWDSDDSLYIGRNESIDFYRGEKDAIYKSPALVLNAIDASTISINKGY